MRVPAVVEPGLAEAGDRLRESGRGEREVEDAVAGEVVLSLEGIDTRGERAVVLGRALAYGVVVEAVIAPGGVEVAVGEPGL